MPAQPQLLLRVGYPLIIQVHTSSLLRRIVHELDIAHLPVLVTHELATKANTIGNIGESKDDGANLSGMIQSERRKMASIIVR